MDRCRRRCRRLYRRRRRAWASSSLCAGLCSSRWGCRSRVVLDVGCGVASFGGFLFDRDALTMSFAPKDEHEAQVQFALERGIPAVSAVMGTKHLPFPGNAFDVVHCARSRLPWDVDGGTLLLEVNRLLRPGDIFVWSATPVYRKVPEDVEIWHAMAALTKSMCSEMVKKTSDTVDQTAMVVFKKPTSNECYDARTTTTGAAEPPLCEDSDDQDARPAVVLASRAPGGRRPGEPRFCAPGGGGPASGAPTAVQDGGVGPAALCGAAHRISLCVWWGAKASFVYSGVHKQECCTRYSGADMGLGNSVRGTTILPAQQMFHTTQGRVGACAAQSISVGRPGSRKLAGSY